MNGRKRDFIYNPPVTPFIDIHDQDDEILVLNKPSGLLSVPGRLEHHKDSLQTRVQSLYPEAKSVHRLDAETSGLILFGLTAKAHRQLSQQFENRQVKKQYIAKVWGIPDMDGGTINAPLICDWPNRPKQIIDFENGKPAETHWKKLSEHDQTSYLALTPITGRSHQLRVHLQNINHPILGDSLYAHDPAFNAAERLCLHAETLEFEHPNTQEWRSFSIPCPF